MEIEENNELNPGYLGKNIEGHEEEYSSQAWSNIESKLKILYHHVIKCETEKLQ
jgi:hypothetical protein